MQSRAGPVSRTGVIVALGVTQTLAWASSYYLVAIVADPMARDLGVSGTAVFAAFSGALLLTAALGPAAGRAIDRQGGRGVLCLSNLVFAAGLVVLAGRRGFGGWRRDGSCWGRGWRWGCMTRRSRRWRGCMGARRGGRSRGSR